MKNKQFKFIVEGNLLLVLSSNDYFIKILKLSTKAFVLLLT
jgi:hypothetical protein